MERSYSRRLRCLALLLTAALASCTGAGNGLQPSSGAVPYAAAPVQPSYLFPGYLSPVNTSPGAVNGMDNQFSPHDGDSKTGGQGSVVDKKVPCLPTMSNEYHVHVFLGIIVNGQYYALPDAIGMVRPGPEVNGFINTATCFYEIHTHDASGIVHLEAAVNRPVTSAYFSLKNVLDVWGIKYGKTQFGKWSGPIHVFTGNVPLRQTTVSSYAAYAGQKYWYLPLYSHEVIWIEIGSGYYSQTQLPPVTFYMEY